MGPLAQLVSRRPPALGHAVAYSADAPQRGAAGADVLAPGRRGKMASWWGQRVGSSNTMRASSGQASARWLSSSLSAHVSVAPRLTERVAREQQARPLDGALLHSLRQAPVGAAAVAHGGEPSAEHAHEHFGL